MDKTSKIRELMRSITGTDKPRFDFRLMEVVKVDGDMCRARIGDFEIPDIRLSSIGGGSENGVLVVPVVGSVILVADSSCGNLRELHAIGYTEIDSIRFHKGPATVKADSGAVELTVGGSTMRITNEIVEFNGGGNDGMVMVAELVKKLNALETSINDLKKVFSGWTPVAQDGGGALKTAVTAWAAASVATTRQEEIENKQVTH